MKKREKRRARYYSEVQINCKCVSDGCKRPKLDGVGVTVEDNSTFLDRLTCFIKARGCETLNDGMVCAIEQLYDALPKEKRDAVRERIASR